MISYLLDRKMEKEHGASIVVLQASHDGVCQGTEEEQTDLARASDFGLSEWQTKADLELLERESPPGREGLQGSIGGEAAGLEDWRSGEV